MPTDMTLAEQARNTRLRLNLTQEQAAKMAKLPLSTYGVAERGSAGFRTRAALLSWIARVEKRGMR